MPALSSLQVNNQVRSQRSSSVIIVPEMLSTSKENWCDYAERFERIAMWNGWSEQDAAIYLMPQITGEPLNYVKRQPLCIQTSWPFLKASLDEFSDLPAIKLKIRG